MNSKGHLYISVTKSVIRMLGCGLAILFKSVEILATLFFIAELLGIFEELVDKR